MSNEAMGVYRPQVGDEGYGYCLTSNRVFKGVITTIETVGAVLNTTYPKLERPAQTRYNLCTQYEYKNSSGETELDTMTAYNCDVFAPSKEWLEQAIKNLFSELLADAIKEIEKAK